VSDIQILPGINIQWPWSQMLLSGQKTVETRSYALPARHKGRPLALIETPGPLGLKMAGISKAQIIAIIVFKESFRYTTKKAWAADHERHLVAIDDPIFGYDSSKPKWGWIVANIHPLTRPAPAPDKKGIVFTNNCLVPNQSIDFKELVIQLFGKPAES
jgi:hypothetical protein